MLSEVIIRMSKKIIVTHHSPDLDAITASWLLQRFNDQVYQDAQFAFVNPGDRLSHQEITDLGAQPDEVTHVDTGLGKFDHHQPEKASDKKCAAMLVFDHLCQVFPTTKDDKALKELVSFVNEIDHFEEIYWPDASNLRYVFMIHELIRGYELVNSQDDQGQLEYGFRCLDYAYQNLKQTVQANQIIENDGIQFSITAGPCVALETSNEEAIKQAQKQGFLLVFRKDPQKGHIRIKIRPDANFSLKALYEAIKKVDPVGSWFYHSSGKMLLNGSLKHRNQVPSQLSIRDVIKLIKQTYP